MLGFPPDDLCEDILRCRKAFFSKQAKGLLGVSPLGVDQYLKRHVVLQGSFMRCAPPSL